MSKKLCDRCGAPVAGGVSMGGAMLCRTCDVDIRPEIDALREAGKPVNVLQIARQHYRANFSGGNYMLREVPRTLEDAWKIRAIKEGCNQRDIALAALVEYLIK